MYEGESRERESLIRAWSQKLLRRLREVLPSQPVEADLQRAIDPMLDEFCGAVGVNALAHAQYRVATGRADAVFNRLVIEYKRPGLLRRPPDTGTREAVRQARRYIEGLAGRQRRLFAERLAGIVFDGCYLVFVRYFDGKWVEEPPVEVNEHSLERFLTWLASLSWGRALTSEHLNDDFNIGQPRTEKTLQALSQGLGGALAEPDGIVAKLFEQWRLFFSESINYSEAFGGRKLAALEKWVRRAGVDVGTPEEGERFFFALHTYFALLVKLLAWLALSRHVGVRLGGPSFGELVSLDGETLRGRLREMESGGIFRAFGISNLLEGDFFSWYLYAWDERIEGAVREMLRRLDEYDPTTLTIVPEETRDLFKKLYHYLLPREIRHNLGEYYTPDWLAERLLNQVDSQFFMADASRHETALRGRLFSTRWLDPACGSGTFPVLIIGRMRELGEALMVNRGELLEAILRNVVGIDLNPLAVLTARVNYLLAISELVEHRRGQIAIPIYVADSVRTPGLSGELFAHGAYEFPTAVGKFLVPAALCEKERFDRFCELLEESVQSEVATESFTRRVEAELRLVPPEWDEQATSRLCALYQRLLGFHRQGMDGLWARLLKNNFAPLTIGQFDYVVGNPPWVNWENLPDEYREALIPLYQDTYKLFPHRGQRARHGSTKIDISTLMTYVVMDALLKPGGRLGFVITQSVFKTDAGKGFRRFHIPQEEGNETPLRVLHVDDMVSLNPFEGASNRTAVMVLEKGRPTRYPVPYQVWRKGKGIRFTYDSTLEEVTAATKRLGFRAEPVNPADLTSPWLTARPKALKAIRKVLGRSDYQAHAGVCGWANSVYWVEIVYKRPDGLVVVRNITEGAKVQVDEVTEPIEPDLLYPLLRGRDVQRWKAEPSALIIVPQDPKDFKHGYPERKFQTDRPKAHSFLTNFKNILQNRPGYKKYLEGSGEPWYSLYDIKNYTFSPWKVVWTRIAQIEAAVVGVRDGKAVVPQETITLVDCKSSEEAHYIAALVNSSPFQFAAVSYSQEGGKSMGSMHIIENIHIPGFDSQDPVHQSLARLSMAAHEAAGQDDSQALREIEAEIDREAAKLWGLTEEELKEIQRSLAELSGEVPSPSMGEVKQ